MAAGAAHDAPATETAVSTKDNVGTWPVSPNRLDQGRQNH
jgi:hypothetical protein